MGGMASWAISERKLGLSPLTAVGERADNVRR
jgi:hypothetical protein